MKRRKQARRHRASLDERVGKRTGQMAERMAEGRVQGRKYGLAVCRADVRAGQNGIG